MIPYDLMKKNPWKEKFFYSEKCMDTKDVYNHGKKGCLQPWKKGCLQPWKKGCLKPWKKKDVYNHGKKECLQPWK